VIGPFLIKLVEHEDTLRLYLEDPVGAMQAEGLSNQEIELVLGGNLRRLREALQKEYPDSEVFLGHVPLVFGHVPQVFGHVPQVTPPESTGEADPSAS
jgi:hypothetical protein